MAVIKIETSSNVLISRRYINTDQITMVLEGNINKPNSPYTITIVFSNGNETTLTNKEGIDFMLQYLDIMKL